jgi:predicted TIM-barrel fold metal-dependent hydrolase
MAHFMRTVLRMKSLLAASMLLLAACRSSAPPRIVTPAVDYHQHLISRNFAPIVHGPEREGAALLRDLDAAGIERAVVLSVACSFADERKGLADPDRLTREENDWTSAQVAKSGGRLIGFCSANPLRPAAIAEIDRCLGLPGMVGIKQHFGNAGVTLRNPQHLARMEEVFDLAARRKAPILVHMRARGGINYGTEDARLFAHLGGSGPGYEPSTDESDGGIRRCGRAARSAHAQCVL